MRLARSESGGVALDVQSAEQLRGAYERMTAALGPAMAEAVVQRMVPGGVETCVAVEAHPAFGPVVSFGLGGAFADMIADRPARSLPLTDLDAAELVSSSRAAEALAALGADGWRWRICCCAWACWPTTCPSSTTPGSTPSWSRPPVPGCCRPSSGWHRCRRCPSIRCGRWAET